MMMLDPSGFLLTIPNSSVLEDMRLRGWLDWDRCPVSTGAVAGQDPCPPGQPMPCPHLHWHRESRVKDHEWRSAWIQGKPIH